MTATADSPVWPASAPDLSGASGAARPAIRLDGLTKRFGKDRGAPVLDGIDLEVAAGEFVCLLGASGCGKSTMLSLIAGLERPTTGTIEVAGPAGDPASASSAKPGHAALMFQEAALFPWLTASGNVELALRLRGFGRSARKAEAARLLQVVRLDGAADKRVHELSGGMRQRVALARALAQQADVLLMDEPFAALDAITRDVLHDELVSVWQRTGVAVLFVTHNVREAVRLGQRVVLMSSRPGRIARQWHVQIPQPRRIEDADVADLAREITSELHREIERHSTGKPGTENRSNESNSAGQEPVHV
ncbi:MAG TPA: ABC transporter ATP-binding protein [Actinocrinis sp.]|jgi:NitT/TauT family transport system ATP-binding protein